MIDCKRWKYFKELSEILRNIFRCAIVKIGYQDELSDVEADYDCVNKLDILETAGVINVLDILITVDTGNMHIADALNIPMVVLFGGSLVSKNGPLSRNAKVLRLGMPCQPCQRTGSFTNCQKTTCLDELYPGKLVPWIIRLLSKK